MTPARAYLHHNTMKNLFLTGVRQGCLALATVGYLLLTACESKNPADQERKDRDEASAASEANPINAESPTPDSASLGDSTSM